MDVSRIEVTKDKGGHLRVAFYGANNEQVFRTQSYRDRHVTRLVESVHEIFPDAEVHVHYTGKGGDLTDYVVDFNQEIKGQTDPIHDEEDPEGSPDFEPGLSPE